MPNSVTIDYPLTGESVVQGFSASGTYIAYGDCTITVSLSGSNTPQPFPDTGGASQPWSIAFPAGTPLPGDGDLLAAIDGGGTGDQSDDINVLAIVPLGPPVILGPLAVQRVEGAAAGNYQVSGTVKIANGARVVCLIQRMNKKHKQARTVSAASKKVAGIAYTCPIYIPAPPGGNKRLVLRVLLLDANSNILGIVTKSL